MSTGPARIVAARAMTSAAAACTGIDPGLRQRPARRPQLERHAALPALRADRGKPERASRTPMRPNLFDGIRPVTRSGALRDAVAGVTLASMNIPQVLGYTRTAGTPVVTGLSTPCRCWWSCSRSSVVAPSGGRRRPAYRGDPGQLALPHGHAREPKYVALVGMVALQTAALLLVARIFKLGFLADFLAHGADRFLRGVGVQVVDRDVGRDAPGVAEHSPPHARANFGSCSPSCHGCMFRHLALSALVAGAILALPSPGPAAADRAVRGGGNDRGKRGLRPRRHGIAVIGPVPGGLPSLGFPDVSLGANPSPCCR